MLARVELDHNVLNFIILSLQGLYQLLEKNVVIRTRQMDVALVKVSVMGRETAMSAA